ncbi:MAG: dienelactone hydrolase family protein [Methylococcaceae bacterium]|nr:dienelactone hydrolase family protein [Methylococcaceae bacterium]MDZ4219166.1 dienelactone hydrolase family protein [Methylobacter sp.]MDP2394695.1 dienelactone hydrolase family protein [Methylococcaceae bacterium]MDP3018004.1 dienelactone hydrolase family protein [Methylococcaceae bacterium]MDP3389687.1 dienelactone hydrolase family protein [Methylococcaceae bacterium]
MAIVSNSIGYLDGDVLLEAYFAFDDAITERRPAVLISHAWGGRDDFVAEKAKKIAELGYVGFALDMYGKGVRGNSPEQNSKLMQPFMADRGLLQKRIKAALYAVRLLPWVDDSKIAAMGFCFGGLCVLDLARAGADLKGVVSFHGLLNPPDNLQGNSIKAKVLALHGHDDPMGPFEQVLAFEQEMTKAGADWQLHTYGHTVHAFTNPKANDPTFGTVYQANADKRSLLAMKNFLAEVFA